MKAAAVAADARKVSASTSAPSRLVVADGTLEALKWLGLVLMALDHVNKFLFAEKLPVIFELGRIAVPLFGFVLACNLARPTALEDLPVHSLRTLLLDLATVTLNVTSTPINPQAKINVTTRPTPLQAKAFALLDVDPTCSPVADGQISTISR